MLCLVNICACTTGKGVEGGKLILQLDDKVEKIEDIEFTVGMITEFVAWLTDGIRVGGLDGVDWIFSI